MPFFWRVPLELRSHLLLTCGSRPDHAIMRQTVGKLLSGETVMPAKPANVNGRSTHGHRRRVRCQRQKGRTRQRQEGQGQKAKNSTTVNKRAAQSLMATVVTVESGGHKQKDCRYGNTVAEVDEEESVEPPNSSGSSSTNRGTSPLLGLISAGTAQSLLERSPR